MKFFASALASALMVMAAGATNAAAADAAGAANWAGPYLGLTVGHSWDDGSFQGNGAFTGSNNSLDMKGWDFGAKAGYDFAIAPSYVLGVVVDASRSDADGNKCV